MRSTDSKAIVSAAKAFADTNRLRILLALKSGELCVCELCDALSLSQSTLSTHLQVIRGATLAAARKEGKWVYYTLTPLGKGMVQFVARTFHSALSHDAAFQRDRKRLKARLSLRESGACCVGLSCARKDSQS